MFNWFKGKSESKEEYKPYVNPFKEGDRVKLVWTLYNEGNSEFYRLSNQDKVSSDIDCQWDIFQIVIDKGKIGTVAWTTRDSVTVDLDGFPFKITVRDNGLRKLRS